MTFIFHSTSGLFAGTAYIILIDISCFHVCSLLLHSNTELFFVRSDWLTFKDLAQLSVQFGGVLLVKIGTSSCGMQL